MVRRSADTLPHVHEMSSVGETTLGSKLFELARWLRRRAWTPADIRLGGGVHAYRELRGATHFAKVVTRER